MTGRLLGLCQVFVYFLAPLSVLLFSQPAALAQAGLNNDNDTVYDIRPLANVDEELFLLNALREIYSQWPTDNQKVGPWIAETRPVVSGLRAAITSHRLSREVAQVYDECLNLLDGYNRYLVNLGIIDQTAKDRAGEVAAESILGAILKGAEAKLEGKSDEEARNSGIFEGASTAVQKGYNVSQERRTAIEAERQKIQSQITATVDSARIAAQRLTRERGWQPGESGFDSFSSEGLLDQVNRRPRDPFALCDYGTADLKDENTAAGAMRRSNWCLRAAQMAPGGYEYDGYRALFIGEAADLALLAVNLESSSTYSRGPTASTPQALRLSKTYLSLDNSDASGFGHSELARALAFSGRFVEAVHAAKVAARSFDHDPWFALRYAKLMSLTNSVEKAGEWLAYAYSLGFSDINSVRTSPDFANLRRLQPQRFSELTTPRLRQPEFIWGVFNDDVVLHNDSPFTLTHVRSKVWIRKGQQAWNLDLKCDSIPAGSICKLTDAVSIPGDAYDDLRATFDCDQFGH